MFTFLAILLAMLGLFVLNRGIRGRRIDGHPHCAKCNFDLHGLTDAPVCPECGASIRGWSSRSIGTFRPRPGLIVTGGLIIVFSLLTISVLSLDLLGRIDWYANMPLWMIEREASSQPSLPSTARARQELLRRAQGGQVPPERLGAFVATMMKPARTDEQLQGELVTFLRVPTLPDGTLDAARKWAFEQHANRSLPLSRQLGEFLDQEFWSGRLEPKEMEAFLRTAVRPELELVGPTVCAPGEKLWMNLGWNWRGGNIELVPGIDIPGVVMFERFPGHFGSSGDSTFLARPFEETRRGNFIASSEPGPHEIKGLATLQITGQLLATYGASGNTPPIIVTFPVSMTYTVDPALPNSPADKTRRQIMRSILIKLDRSQFVAGPGGLISVSGYCAPYSAEMDIEWTDGTKYYPLGKSVITSLTNSSSLSFSGLRGSLTSTSYESRNVMAVSLAPSDVPSTVRGFRAHVRKVFLQVPGSPPSPVESFDLEFPIAPEK